MACAVEGGLEGEKTERGTGDIEKRLEFEDNRAASTRELGAERALRIAAGYPSHAFLYFPRNLSWTFEFHGPPMFSMKSIEGQFAAILPAVSYYNHSTQAEPLVKCLSSISTSSPSPQRDRHTYVISPSAALLR